MVEKAISPARGDLRSASVSLNISSHCKGASREDSFKSWRKVPFCQDFQAGLHVWVDRTASNNCAVQ